VILITGIITSVYIGVTQMLVSLGYHVPMDDATRYQREFDLLIQEAEAEAMSRNNADRDRIWRTIEKSFNAMAESAKLTLEKREALKRQILERAVQHIRGSES
jgi:hypothetical protein